MCVCVCMVFSIQFVQVDNNFVNAKLSYILQQD